MTETWRRALLTLGVLLCVCVGFGCNLLTVPFFLFGPESKREAELGRIASDNKDKTVKVVILSYGGLETRPEYINIDRELSAQLAKHLKEGFKYNKEKVTIVSPKKVEEFKNETPRWHTLGLEEVGQKFDADFVIYLEINKISLYEKGMGHQLYRGRAEITVTVVDTSKPGETPTTKEFSCVYPSEARGPIAGGEGNNAREFRQAFLNHAAKRLSWFFTSHPTNDEFDLK